MFEITVKISKPRNILSHAMVKVKEMQTEKCYIVSYGETYGETGTSVQHVVNLFDNELNFKEKFPYFDCWLPDQMVLHSHRKITLKKFIEDIENKFKNSTFSYCCNNCADAANYTLNYFFLRSKNGGVETMWQTYKCVTFPCCIVTCGMTPFFGAPPLTTGPCDVLRKAQLLAKYYGAPPEREADDRVGERFHS